MVNYEFIGARIREARLRKKLSQEQLAAMVDVGTSHISHAHRHLRHKTPY